MSLFDEIKKKLSHEFIDIIEWLDNTDNTIVHRFERYQNEMSCPDILALIALTEKNITFILMDKQVF